MRANKEQEGIRVWKENIVAMEVFVNKIKTREEWIRTSKKKE